MTAMGGLNGECLHRTFAYGLEACERCPSLERLHGTWIDREGCRQIDGVRQHRLRGGRVDGIRSGPDQRLAGIKGAIQRYFSDWESVLMTRTWRPGSGNAL